MTETVRETKRADELKPGDWTINLGRARDFEGVGRAEVLFALPYTDDVGNSRVYVTVAEEGYRAPQSARVSADEMVQLLTEDEQRAGREHAARAQKIADIRALADWLEATPSAPIPNSLDASAHLDERHPSGPSVADSLAKVRALGDLIGAEPETRLNDRTVVRKLFGSFVYSAIAWHKDGRPAEPEPEPEDERCQGCGEPMRLIGLGYVGHIPGEICAPAEDLAADPTGLAYTRADDEPDDPTPVSPARVPMHTGAMTDGGLVDETPARLTHFSERATWTACSLLIGGSSFPADDGWTNVGGQVTCPACLDSLAL
jgi:hypothetical protein